MSALSVLYRGSLVSCNYGCDYCPFAKRRESRAEMDRDREQVERFVSWCREQRRPLRLLFTPWGEALIRPWYQAALAAISRLPHVERVAIQTNLSAPLEWTAEADLAALSLWATYHPTEVARARFLDRCRDLDQRGVRYCVGVVGLAEHAHEIEALRAELRPDVYLWINAYKREGPSYYDQAQRALLERVDPLFAWNDERHESRGRPCRTGSTAITVDGQGTIRRCHFVSEPLGSIYEAGWERRLWPAATPCPNQTCGCYIGYVHLEPLGLERVYGEGLLERIPDRLPVAPSEGSSAPAPSRAHRAG
jgi:organic radical activating enzyme